MQPTSRDRGEFTREGSLILMNVHVFRGTPDFSFINVRPGEHVVIKPNLVKEGNEERDMREWEHVITSAVLIRQVCEHVAQCLSGRGCITICDAPQTDSSFTKISALLKLDEIAADIAMQYGITVEILDLRNEEWTKREEIIVERRRLPGDPRGAITFNLGSESLFYKHLGTGHYFGADYDMGEINRHHHGTTQEYLICATPIVADVFINMPKLKTHKKTGVTLSLKNLVGINANKNWLPHHTEGTIKNKADQFPSLTLIRRMEQWSLFVARVLLLHAGVLGTYITRKLRKVGKAAFGDSKNSIRSGNWYGNDTAWRMVLDLNRCLLYGNADGTLRRNNPKRYYSVIDGVLGMEGDGPMGGIPINSNVIICGEDPVAVDTVASRVMGFDWRKIPVIREAYNVQNLPVTKIPIENITVISDEPKWCGKFIEIENQDFLHFTPHFGWKDHIEY
jgi:uncharacterized protein (DUF362 family)